jgi:hypothetical protein
MWKMIPTGLKQLTTSRQTLSGYLVVDNRHLTKARRVMEDGERKRVSYTRLESKIEPQNLNALNAL